MSNPKTQFACEGGEVAQFIMDSGFSRTPADARRFFEIVSATKTLREVDMRADLDFAAQLESLREELEEKRDIAALRAALAEQGDEEPTLYTDFRRELGIA